MSKEKVRERAGARPYQEFAWGERFVKYSVKLDSQDPLGMAWGRKTPM
ncbi:MAG: hypothetical protein HOH33_01825 [Verrucomicrobia bacterium]|nr:hypothetical protein [Verrucomicrobiota bacterium]